MSRSIVVRLAAAATLALCLAGCERPPSVHVFAPGEYPARLSQWGLLRRDGDTLVLGRGLTPYEVNTPLFSDYALKLRAFYLPDGTAMSYRSRGGFDFPVGSVVTKTFFYPSSQGGSVGGGGPPGNGGLLQAKPRWNGNVADLDLAGYRLVETRLLVRRAEGWEALPYVWDGDDAYLHLTGALVPMMIRVGEDVKDLPYVVPARSECAGCHATDHAAGTLTLIGFRARHVNRTYPGATDNQLMVWARRGALRDLPDLAAVPRNAVWDDPAAPLADRARAYLDSNCGHCHSPTGAADTSGLWLDAQTTSHRHLGFCKPPVAAGRGSGGRDYAIVPGAPDRSILVYRVESDEPDVRMPETGRSLTHREGVTLIRRWIGSLPGRCL